MDTQSSIPSWITQLNQFALQWYAVARQGQPVPTYVGTGVQPTVSVHATDRAISATIDPTLLIVIAVVGGVLVWSLLNK